MSTDNNTAIMLLTMHFLNYKAFTFCHQMTTKLAVMGPGLSTR